MQLPRELIDEYIEIRKSKTGEKLGYKEGKVEATDIMNFTLYILDAPMRLSVEE